MDKKDIVIRNNANEINSFIGKKFEKACIQFVIYSKIFQFTKIGKEWGQKINNRETYEIDIVALDENKKEASFIECKWSNLNYLEAKKILEELKEKSKNVIWERKKEYFCIIAKKLKDKQKLRTEGYLVFDLEDF